MWRQNYQNLPAFFKYNGKILTITFFKVLWSVLHNTFFMDLKFEILPSFVHLTFHQIYLAQDGSKFSFFSVLFMDWTLKIFQVLSSTLFIWYTYLLILPLFLWILNLEKFQVLSSTLFIWYIQLKTEVNFLCSVLHYTYIFFIDWTLKTFQVLASILFIWYTYFLILTLFYGFEIWKYSKFCPPHFSFDIPSSGQM